MVRFMTKNTLPVPVPGVRGCNPSQMEDETAILSILRLEYRDILKF